MKFSLLSLVLFIGCANPILAQSCVSSIQDCGKFGGNSIAAVILLIIYSLVLFFNVRFYIKASRAMKRAEMFQSSHVEINNGYVQLNEVLPPEVCNYVEMALDDQEKNQLVWVGSYHRSKSWKVGCGITAVFFPLVGIMFCLIAWLVVGQLIFFISGFIITMVLSLLNMAFLSRFTRVTVYCMTPTDAIIIGNPGCSAISCQRFPYSDMLNLETIILSEGLGTLYFGSQTISSKHGHSNMKIGFVNIKNVKEVETKMRELKQLASTKVVMMPQPFMSPVMMNGNGMQPQPFYYPVPSVQPPIYTTPLQ